MLNQNVIVVCFFKIIRYIKKECLFFTNQSIIIKSMGRQSDAKQRILDTARELFHARSYSAVGIQEICDHAMVKKGSFYHFFPSKQALTLELLEQSWQKFEQNFLQHVKNSEERPVLQRITRFFELGEQFQQHLFNEKGCILGCPYGNLAIELSTQDEVLRNRLSKSFMQMEALFEDVLKEAVQVGELPENTDTYLSAKAILAYLEGLFLMAKTYNQLQDFKALSALALKLIVSR